MFTVQRSHLLQWRARLDVFFQYNQVRNFSVVGTYFDDSAKVYHADTLIAEVFIYLIIFLIIHHMGDFVMDIVINLSGEGEVEIWRIFQRETRLCG